MGQPIVRAWKTLEKRRRHSDGNGAYDSADSIVQFTLILVENRDGFSQMLHRPLQIVHVEALAGTAESRVDVGNRLAYLLSGVFQYFTSFHARIEHHKHMRSNQKSKGTPNEQRNTTIRLQRRIITRPDQQGGGALVRTQGLHEHP